MYLYLTFDAKWTITNPICIHLMNLCQCTAVAKNANDFYLAAPLMQSRIAFGIQMHFVINFAANFFFRLTFFHLFHKVFQGCGIFFFNVVLVHLCIWQTRANTKRTTHSWNTLLKPTRDLDRISYHWSLCWLLFGWLIWIQNRFCDNVKLNSPRFW